MFLESGHKLVSNQYKNNVFIHNLLRKPTRKVRKISQRKIYQKEKESSQFNPPFLTPISLKPNFLFNVIHINTWAGGRILQKNECGCCRLIIFIKE